MYQTYMWQNILDFSPKARRKKDNKIKWAILYLHIAPALWWEKLTAKNRGLIIIWEISPWAWDPTDEWTCRCRCRCTHSLPQRWIKVSGQLHDPPDLLPGKKHWYTSDRQLCGTQILSGCFGEETTNTLPLPSNEPLFRTCPSRASSFYCLMYSGLRSSSLSVGRSAEIKCPIQLS
jgi:hypothetical protein